MIYVIAIAFTLIFWLIVAVCVLRDKIDRLNGRIDNDLEKTTIDDLPYTHYSEELNCKVAELMSDYACLVAKAKNYGLDIRMYPDSKTLTLYFHDDHPHTLLVDKYSSMLPEEKES